VNISLLNRMKYSGSGQDHANGNVERRDVDASELAIGDDSTVICKNAPLASHGVAQVAIHSQAASQGTGVVNVHHKGMVAY
jgi:hypothetical protein